jgi:2-keto-4-pentenoate hydratase/2-oxohepta-3-ene-1,7-dioic acid hydratase in catechol pathway
MRIATVRQRASLIAGAGAVDIHEASGGRSGPGAADLYERRPGFVDWAAATPPQFSLGKSYPRFGPAGPWLVTVDDFDDPDDLDPGCAINGEQMQKGRTRDLIFGVADLVEQLSRVTPLPPGDLVFTGTPQGGGLGRTPPRWLAPGDELTSCIEGIGEMRHRFFAGPYR